MRVVGLVIGALLFACTVSPDAEPGDGVLTGDALLLADAVASRIAAGDIPDFHFLPDTGAVVVVQYQQSEGTYDLTGADLEPLAGRPVVVVTPDSLRSLVRLGRVDYIILYPVSRDDDTWRMRFEVAFETPEPMPLPPLCCCWGTAVFTQEVELLEFHRWESRGCS